MMTQKLAREIDVSFETLAQWQAWREENPAYDTAAYRDEILAEIMAFGLHEPLTGAYAFPAEIERGHDLREGLNVRGIISRQRAVLHLIQKSFEPHDLRNLRVYAPEAVTAMALRLRGIFPKFIGSEFTLDERLRAAMYPIPLEDLTALSLPSGTFDLVVSNEVLEHVPDVDAALSEMARILRPGGWHISTHPLVHAEASIQKSRLEDGRIVHLTEPEYHGDPFNAGGSLVFQIPGWDILARSRAAGFSQATLHLMVSRDYGYLTSQGVGIFVLCCRR